MSIEEYLLINCLLDGLTVLCAQRATGLVRPARALAATALGTAYALLGRLSGLEALRGRVPALLCGLAMGALSAGRWQARCMLRSGVLCLCAGCTLGGVAVAFGGGRIGAACALGAGALFCLAGSIRRRSAGRTLCRLRLTVSGRRAVCTALVDSGNGLTEPLLGLPVLIVERDLLSSLLGEAQLGLLEREARVAVYATLSGRGEMPCLTGAGVECLCRGRWRTCPPVCLGLYPGTMSGEHRAIAPSALEEP